MRSQRSRIVSLPIGVFVTSLLGAVGVGCGAFEPPPPPPPFKAIIFVDGDPGQKLAGATVARGGTNVATTGADGKAEVVVQGAQEGTSFDVTVACPTGYVAPSKPITVKVTRTLATKNERWPEFTTRCTPTKRKVVVAIRADNGANLPVKYLNQVVTTTDATGAASLVLDLEPGTFQLALDTSGHKHIKPQNPAKVFTVSQKDDVMLFDQKFEVEKKKVIVRKHEGPKCISCTKG
jgi:hypothetical protein